MCFSVFIFLTFFFGNSTCMHLFDFPSCCVEKVCQPSKIENIPVCVVFFFLSFFLSLLFFCWSGCRDMISSSVGVLERHSSLCCNYREHRTPPLCQTTVSGGKCRSTSVTQDRDLFVAVAAEVVHRWKNTFPMNLILAECTSPHLTGDVQVWNRTQECLMHWVEY